MGLTKNHLLFLNYIKDKMNYLYCVRGVANPKNRILASLIYVPETEDLADRKDIKNNIFYIKKIIDTPLDNPSIKNLSKKNKEYIEKIKIRLNKKEFIVAPKRKDIIEVFSHVPLAEGLNWIDNKTRRFLNLLQRNGVPFREIYLYGSKSIGLKRIKNNTQPSDVDIIIRGLKYLENLKSLDEKKLLKVGYKRYYSEKNHKSDPLTLSNRRKRNMLSFVGLDNKSLIDVKFIRSNKDINSYPKLIRSKIPITIRGRIINDSETTTMPCCYRVLDEKNKEWIVATNLFRYLGVAYNEDKVEIRGLKVQKSKILVNRSHHYIFPY